MITFTEAQIVAWLSPMMWPFLRVLALFSSAPVLSSKSFPARARIGLALLVAWAAQSSLAGQPQVLINSPAAAGAAMQQVLVGLSIGFAVRVVFAAVELAGELIGLQMGLNFASFFDPTSNAQSGAVASMYNQMSAWMFIVLNGHLMVIAAVIASFRAFPMGSNFVVNINQMRLHLLGAELFSLALWVALPVIAVLMLVNVTMGIVSRISPQMNIFAIGFPITLIVGLLGVAFSLPLLDTPMTSMLEQVIAMFLEAH